MTQHTLALATSLFTLVCAADGQLCPQWSPARPVGALDAATIPEASGLAASRRYPGRLYHINDSGNAPVLYLTDAAGAAVGQTALPPMKDSEDLALGPCGDGTGRDCVFVADTGDNNRRRTEVGVLVVPEVRTFPAEAAVWKRLRLRYPDGPHDAESLAVHPVTGDLFLLAKEFALLPGHGRSARLYRLTADVWRRAGTDRLTWEPYGEIDLPALAAKEGATFSHVATSMDISPDGKRLLILTYDHAWEIAWDLADGPPPPTAQLQRGRDYQLVQLEPMLGKETIAWLPDGKGFLQGKEFKPDGEPSVLFRLDCSAP
ncbi:MAG: hypothetical protein GC160_07795 [Acidobacteria bacterium]|nr:hypothetical protein [Acidobacteriota bacterium]